MQQPYHASYHECPILEKVVCLYSRYCGGAVLSSHGCRRGSSKELHYEVNDDAPHQERSEHCKDLFAHRLLNWRLLLLLIKKLDYF